MSTTARRFYFQLMINYYAFASFLEKCNIVNFQHPVFKHYRVRRPSFVTFQP